MLQTALVNDTLKNQTVPAVPADRKFKHIFPVRPLGPFTRVSAARDLSRSDVLPPSGFGRLPSITVQVTFELFPELRLLFWRHL